MLAVTLRRGGLRSGIRGCRRLTRPGGLTRRTGPGTGNHVAGAIDSCHSRIVALFGFRLPGPLTPVRAAFRLTALWRAHRILLDHTDLHRCLSMIQP